LFVPSSILLFTLTRDFAAEKGLLPDGKRLGHFGYYRWSESASLVFCRATAIENPQLMQGGIMLDGTGGSTTGSTNDSPLLRNDTLPPGDPFAYLFQFKAQCFYCGFQAEGETPRVCPKCGGSSWERIRLFARDNAPCGRFGPRYFPSQP
jgi:hypothetical protein